MAFLVSFSDWHASARTWSVIIPLFNITHKLPIHQILKKNKLYLSHMYKHISAIRNLEIGIEDLKIFTSICDGFEREIIKELDEEDLLNVKEKWCVVLLKTNDACQSHMALKAGCCVLGFPSGPAEHLNRMEDSGLVGLIVPTCLLVLSSMRSQIYDYSTIRSIIMMYYQRANMVAFYYCVGYVNTIKQVWCRFSPSHRASSTWHFHMRICEDEGRILNDMHRITTDECFHFKNSEFKFQMNLHSLVTMCAISTALRLCDM
ncbi:hypothetical protein T4A_3982 [Trichinella pseudospiralis]|uniref:Uncharacterized protein n=1 Tax=Trichinella pseudospiralis TaxID=6337 RepID=A0A0V1EFC5_TRIPS|nr:hypothetical protein T4A_3982 [Trichinella pseudospiralis]